jgi:predicted nucleic acid-binding protein
MNVRRVYLDVCVLCRPFDDQQQARIHLETQALELILASIRDLDRELIVSTVHKAEISAIRDIQERQHLQNLLVELGAKIPFNMTVVRKRAEDLANEGMGVADAAHVAFAESAQADFVSVDDRLIKQCKHLMVNVWCGSPLAYCDKEDLR